MALQAEHDNYTPAETRRTPERTAYPAGGSTTTWYYRTTGGSRASTTSQASIPAGAVVEGKVTS